MYIRELWKAYFCSFIYGFSSPLSTEFALSPSLSLYRSVSFRTLSDSRVFHPTEKSRKAVMEKIEDVHPTESCLMVHQSGTRKPLSVRVVAHHTDCTFIRVSGSELVQKYIGEGS